ncbi:hypothetical protein MPER_04058 [Moniliophthora perniciosa FA553]|nr:hypothetical protein MPER_04058 [Moniliophthora perniciosa FA553]
MDGARPTLYDLLILTFSHNRKLTNLHALKSKAGLVLSNLGNYRSFGFTKIIPRLSQGKFEAVVHASQSSKASELWNSLKEHIYATGPPSATFIGKRSEGHVSNYYLGECISDDEVAQVQMAAEQLGVDILNTRVSKNGPGDFALLVASAQSQPAAVHDLEVKNSKIKLTVEYGDHASALQKVVAALQEARKYTANEHQTPMIEAYIKSFNTVSIADHNTG